LGFTTRNQDSTNYLVINYSVIGIYLNCSSTPVIL